MTTQNKSDNIADDEYSRLEHDTMQGLEFAYEDFKAMLTRYIVEKANDRTEIRVHANTNTIESAECTANRRANEDTAIKEYNEIITLISELIELPITQAPRVH